MDILTAGLVIFVSLLVLVLFGNYVLVKYYIDIKESTAVSTFTTVLSLSITLVCVLIVPIDILLVSSEFKYKDLLSERTFREILICFLMGMMFLAFFLVPFSYFYTEEVFDDELNEKSVCEKSLDSLKYTTLTILFCAILVVFGLSFKLEHDDWGERKEWVKKLFDMQSGGENAIAFSVACLTVIGGGFWSIYTSYGMAVLPVLLIWGRKSDKDQIKEIDYSISQINDRIKEIELNPGKNKKRQAELKALEKEQKKMIKKSEKIKEKKESFSLNVLFKLLVPFRVIIGIVFFVLAISFVISLLIGCVNRLMHSECGYKCGYITEKNLLINPLDYFLVHASVYFPVDYLIFICIVLLKFIGSVYGIVSIGVRICCVMIFPVHPGKTLPQGMLLVSVIIMLIFLGISIEILTVFPIYSTFGYQKYEENGEAYFCSFENFGKSCVMTNISQLFNKLSLGLPVFSLLVFIENWVFVLCFAIYGYKGMNDGDYSLLDEDDEDY